VRWRARTVVQQHGALRARRPQLKRDPLNGSLERILVQAMTLDRPLVNALILALALVIAGAFVGGGFARGRQTDRYVTVKGVSERPARADLALWPLRIVVAGNDLPAAYNRLNGQVKLARAFLAHNSIDTAQVEVQDFSVTDASANQVRVDERGGSRYVIRQTLMVRSTDPSKVAGASQHVGQLVQAGVVLSSGEEYRAGGPTYVFTGLNSLKPPMIAEATARAREAATQFANDSHSKLGGIRQADQGVFVILPRDQAPGVQEESQIEKTVRVVTTAQYFLHD